MIERLRRRRDGEARRAALERVRTLPAHPLISVLMPTYETDPKLLSQAIESVRRQSYHAWELCVADDGSRSPAVRREIERHAREDPRVKALLGEVNGGISHATNRALEAANGDFVAMLDHDDVLTPHALLEIAEELTSEPAPDIVYSDSDKLTELGRRGDPFFKPDWSPTYALGAMYVGHLLVVRRELAERVGGFDSSFDTIQDFEFLLRASEHASRIVHVPRILYHWRAVPGSIAAGTDQKAGVEELQVRAVNEHLERLGATAAAEAHDHIPHRARLAAPPAPLASVAAVVAPGGSTGQRDRLIDALRSTPGVADVIECEAGLPGRAAALNRGAAKAETDQLLFCAPHTEPAGEAWLEQLQAHLALPWVVAVSPLLVHPDGRAHAAGYAIGLDAPAVAMLSGTPSDSDGYYGAMACARDVSAISGEFMLVDRAAFEQAGRFNEAYAAEYEDFDLSMRLRAGGGSVVYAPRPRVITHLTPAERRSREDVVDRALFVDCWYDELERGDPYYNAGFSRVNADFIVEPVYPAGSRPAR